MTRPVLGLDIGGANLKAAHTSGAARSVPFALWRDPGGLDAALGRLVAELPAYDALAVTMTGELCDCFASKREGVNHILDAVEGRSKTVRVWTNEGAFVDVPTARREALKVASANWLALATFAGRYAPEGPALLIDIGTTTTDIVPLLDGRPVPDALTDSERMQLNGLLYLGWKRTPLCAIAGRDYAAELFATMQDACLVLGLVAEDPNDRNTADGQPATVEAAERRIARMLCADLETCSRTHRRALALDVIDIFRTELNDCVNHIIGVLPDLPDRVLVSGSGAFLVAEEGVVIVAGGPTNLVMLNTVFGEAVSEAACAYAVAVLAQELEG